MAEAKPIIIQSPFEGWISEPAGRAAALAHDAALQGREGQYTHSTAISLFRVEKPGHIAPGEVLVPAVDIGTQINELVLNGGIDSLGTTWVVLKNSRLLALVRDSATSVATKFDVTLGGSHAGHSPLATSYMPD